MSREMPSGTKEKELIFDLGGPKITENKREEKKEETQLPPAFFNQEFAFRSQRFIEPKKEILVNWDRYFHLRKQDTVVFKNLDRLIKANGNEQQQQDYEELKDFFKKNQLNTRKQAEAVKDESLLEEYAQNVRKLLYFYDRYYEADLIQDIEKLGEKDEDRLPKGVSLNLKNFYVKAFPFLAEQEQGDIYRIFTENREKSDAKVMPLNDLSLQKKERAEALFDKRNEIINDLVKLPLEHLSELHPFELKSLLDFVQEIISIKDQRVLRMRQKNPNFLDRQLDRYKKIETNIKREIRRKDEEIAVERLTSQAERVLSRYHNFSKLKKDGMKFADLEDYLKELSDDPGNPVYAFMKAKSVEDYPEIIRNVQKKNWDRIYQVLYALDEKIVRANREFNEARRQEKAEKLREDIKAHLAGADLATSRDFWLAMGEDPKDISRRFALGEMETVPFKIRKKFLDAVDKKIAAKEYNELNSLDLDLEFKKTYNSLAGTGVLNPEYSEEWKVLGERFAAAENNKMKKILLGKLNLLEIKNLTLTFSNLKDDLLDEFAGTDRQKEIDILANNFEKAVGSFAKTDVYNELVDLAESWGIELETID